MKRQLTTQCTHLHPKKLRAEAKAAAKTRAPWPWAPFSPRASANWRGAPSARCWMRRNTQGPPHHCNTMMDMDAMFPMMRVCSAPNPRKDTLSGPPPPPPLDAAAALRRRSVRAWQASPLLAPATPLSFIFIACSPLLLRFAPSPANAWLRTDCRLLPTSIFGEMCAAPTALVPIALSATSGGSLQRMQARKRGRANLSLNRARYAPKPRALPSPPHAPTPPNVFALLPRRLTCCTLRPAC